MKIQGTVQWYNSEKRYGFIKPDSGSKDVFVHEKEIKTSGINFLKENAKVEFEIKTNEKGREYASNIQLIK